MYSGEDIVVHTGAAQRHDTAGGSNRMHAAAAWGMPGPAGESRGATVPGAGGGDAPPLAEGGELSNASDGSLQAGAASMQLSKVVWRLPQHFLTCLALNGNTVSVAIAMLVTDCEQENVLDLGRKRGVP